jgi:hypothetical protein
MEINNGPGRRAAVRDSSAMITQWLRSLEKGDHGAVPMLWDKYFQELAVLARGQLSAAQRRLSDEEDVALSVLDTLVRGAEQGRFRAVHDRAQLWGLMVALTNQKVVNRRRHQSALKRGNGRVGGEEVLGELSSGIPLTLDAICSQTPTPDFLVALDDEHQYLMGLLGNDNLRTIAREILSGSSTTEIATQMQVSLRTVQRKLLIIRAIWAEALAREIA